MSELAKKGNGGSGAKSASGTITTNGTQTSITVSGIGFQPTGVEVLCVTQKVYSFNQSDEIVYIYNNNNVEKHQIHTYDSNSLQVVNLGGTLTPNSDGFTLTGFANLRFVQATFNWRAWKE